MGVVVVAAAGWVLETVDSTLGDEKTDAPPAVVLRVFFVFFLRAVE